MNRSGSEVQILHRYSYGVRPTGEVVRIREVSEMAAKPLVAVVVVTLDGRVFDRRVHPLDLSIRPWVVRFGQLMRDPVRFADYIKPQWP